MKKLNREKCHIKLCNNLAHARGLCMTCYVCALRKIKKNKNYSWEEFEQLNLCKKRKRNSSKFESALLSKL